jgi:hypothetical protein
MRCLLDIFEFDFGYRSIISLMEHVPLQSQYRHHLITLLLSKLTDLEAANLTASKGKKMISQKLSSFQLKDKLSISFHALIFLTLFKIHLDLLMQW